MIDENWKKNTIEKMAKAMQKDFPVVNTGMNHEGKWGVKPLELAIFERAAEAAFNTMIAELPEESPCNGSEIYKLIALRSEDE